MMDLKGGRELLFMVSEDKIPLKKGIKGTRNLKRKKESGRPSSLGVVYNKKHRIPTPSF